MMPGVPSRNKGKRMGAWRRADRIMKHCTKCGLTVPMDEAKLHFRVNLVRGDGLGDYCINCEKAMQKKWRDRKKAEEEAAMAALGIVSKKAAKAAAPPAMKQCPTCGFECKKEDAAQFFKSHHRTCMKCEEDAVTSLNARWVEAKEKAKKEIKLNGCVLVPGRDGQRCAKWTRGDDCEHYETCLDAVADRGWIGWKTVVRVGAGK